MARLPAGLKKRLENSLANLTPREAGRLLLIYAHEAHKKDVEPSDYPPRKELWEALNARVARSRGKPEEREAVNHYNGVVYLQNMIPTATEVFFRTSAVVAFQNFQAMSGLLILMQQDAMAEAIRTFRSNVQEDFPSPVSVEDYDRLVAWAQTDALVDIADAAENLFLWLDQPEIDKLKDRQDLAAAVTAGEAKDVADAFGDWAYETLVAKVRAGELVGGEGYWSNEIEYPVLIENGTIPAWAALRLVWRQYIRSRGLQIYNDRTRKSWSPAAVDEVGLHGEILADKDLLKLVADFYKDCRRRPWGKGLVAKPDPDQLVKLLTQSATPFLHLNPLDLGRVNWEAFVDYEKFDWRGKPFQTEYVATAASLNQLPADITIGYRFGNLAYLRGQFYPTEDPEYRREEIARTLAMFQRLDTTRQPFTFDRNGEGEMSLSEFMGVKFMTPFEEAIGRLRRAKSSQLAVSQAVKTISDRYFDGLPILIGTLVHFIEEGEEYLASAERVLTAWLQELQKWPWKLNTEGFQVGDVEPDQEFADQLVEEVIMRTRRISRLTESEADLLGD